MRPSTTWTQSEQLTRSVPTLAGRSARSTGAASWYCIRSSSRWRHRHHGHPDRRCQRYGVVLPDVDLLDADPALTVTKTADRATVAPGEGIIYEITYANFFR